MSKPLKVPKYPEIILTPLLDHSPDLKILEQACRRILTSDEVYSVTFSSVVCPVDNRFLYSLQPYYWEVTPGKWERRDGQRNHFCDLPQGQTQLQNMAKAVYTLALGVRYFSASPETKRACLDRLEKLATVFFVKDETRMLPQVEYAQCDPSSDPPRGTKQFIITCRYLLLVSQSLGLIRSSLSPHIEGEVCQWLQDHVGWLESSTLGRAASDGVNNVSKWYHAVLCSHLTYLDPRRSVHLARSHFSSYRNLSPGDYLSDELARTRPRHYTLFMLEPTFILTALTCSSDHITDAGGINPERSGEGCLTPSMEDVVWLRNLVAFARGVKGADMESEVESDERYFVKLRWFERMLESWRAESESHRAEGLEGRFWEGGWTQFSKLVWSTI